MRYTVYILRCLSTGTHWIGMTDCLHDRIAKIVDDQNGRFSFHPEILHIEQHDAHSKAHHRLQTIRSQWKYYSILPDLAPVIHASFPTAAGPDA